MTKVTVTEYRNRINALEDILNTHHHSCVSKEERSYNARRAQSAARSLIEMDVRRAKQEDLERA